MRLILVLINIFLTFSVMSQNLNETIEKMKTTTSKGFSCDLNYKLYKRNDNTIHEETKGTYMFSSSGYFFKIGSTTYIGNNEEVVLINDDVSIMALLSADDKNSFKGQLDFEKLSPLFDTVFLLNKNGKNSEYRIVFKESALGNYEKIDITINTTSYLPSKIKIYFRNEINFSKSRKNENIGKPYIVINYTDVKKESLPESTFDTKKYYTVSENGKCSGTGKYIDYEFHNQKHLR